MGAEIIIASLWPSTSAGSYSHCVFCMCIII